jgi:Flp pilus assembly protein TadG
VTRRRGHDHGSATVELVLVAPVFALLLALVVAAGRAQSGRADVEAAARGAAREITLARNPEEAVGPARAGAAATVRQGSATCRSMGWDVHLADDAATVRVSCTVDLAQAAMLPFPASYTVSASATEPLDRYRERGP